MCVKFYLYKIIVEENKSVKLLIDCYNDKYVGIFPQMFLNLEMFLSIQDTRILMFFQLWNNPTDCSNKAFVGLGSCDMIGVGPYIKLRVDWRKPYIWNVRTDMV